MPETRTWFWLPAGDGAVLAEPGQPVRASLGGVAGRIGVQAISVRRGRDRASVVDAATGFTLAAVETDWAGRGVAFGPREKAWSWQREGDRVRVADGAVEVVPVAGLAEGIARVVVRAGFEVEDATLLAVLAWSVLMGEATRPGATLRSGAARPVRAMLAP